MKNRRTVTLTKKHLNELETHACGTYPEEACALLVGTITVDMDYHISEVILSPNVAENKNQFFEIDPAVRIRLERHLRDKEHQVIGVYHSHPDGEAKPSETDARMIIEPDLVWIISSVDVQQKLITNAFLPAVTEGFTEMTIQHKKSELRK